MTRVAALYDVHGHLAALDAVLAEVPDDAVVVIGGDVAYGAYPAETVERLRGLGERVRWIRGNADRELDPALADPAEERIMRSLEWVRARVTPEQVAFLTGNPPTLTLDVDGLGRVLFCHATPRNDVDVFLASTPEERVAPHFQGVDADVVVCGHTHMQFDRRVGGVRVVNAGSVGMAYEDEPGAYWALLGPDVEHWRTPYEPDHGEWPDEWPEATRTEATEYLEQRAV